MAIETDVGFFTFSSDMSAAVTAMMNDDYISFRTVDMSWETAPEIDKPDLLKITFSGEMPTAAFSSTDKVAYYFRFKPEWERTADKWETVGCVLNGDASPGTLINY